MKIIATVVTLLSLSQFAAAGVNFDQAIDVQAAIKAAKSAEMSIPEAKYGIPVFSTRDCKKITFTETSPLASPEVKLESREEFQDCQNFGYPVGQICTPRFEYYRENAQIVITEPRLLVPDQTETFEVCLWGPFLNLKQVTPAYKYTVNRVLNVFRLTPQAVPAAKAAPAQEFCRLVMDGNFCVYQCQDGSYISKPNPFPAIPAPNPWVGPIVTPCRPTVPFTPLITIQE